MHFLVKTYHYRSLSVYLSICFSVFLSIYLSIYLSISLSAHLSIYRLIYLSYMLSICLSICLSLCLSACLFMSVYLSVDRLSWWLVYVFMQFSHFSRSQGFHVNSKLPEIMMLRFYFFSDQELFRRRAMSAAEYKVTIAGIRPWLLIISPSSV